jgi:radical SAM superfamily enzyme YgiQ (UPF0313 family)
MIAMYKVLLASISFSAYEWLPYPVGTLISHCLKDPSIRSRYQFLEPEYRSYSLNLDSFHQKLKQADILGLTNWVWNQHYNDQIAQLYKSYRPNGTIIYGGTNVPENRGLAEAYRQKRPYVDLFFCGPAEENFRLFLDLWPQVAAFHQPGTFSQKSFSLSKDDKSYHKLDISFPYLDGIFDDIIRKAKDPLSAIFETNRGCPYSCSFCDWGGMTRSRIVMADQNRVKETIQYIMGHENIERIEIADANYGMFARDLDYVNLMVDLQKRRKNPIHLSMGGFAKNGGKYVEPIMELLHQHFDAHHGRKYIKFGFQSHSQEVLHIAQRDNIKNERLDPMIKRFQSKGISVDAEMIIGLPGETKESWIQSIQKNMDLRVNHQKSFNLYVVANTLLSDPEYRKEYKIKTKKLLIPHDLYHRRSMEYHLSRQQDPIFTECDFSNPNDYQENEFIYQCFSYDSEELMAIYDVWFWFNTLYNAKVARDAMLRSSLSAKEQYESFISLINDDKMPLFKKLLTDFRYGVWNTIAKPEPVTQVRELFLVNFAMKFAFRGNEVVDIFHNQKAALSELRLIYPDIDFLHFRQDINLKDTIKLYFVGAEVV